MFFRILGFSSELLGYKEENQKFHFSIFLRCLRLIFKKKYIELWKKLSLRK